MNGHFSESGRGEHDRFQPTSGDWLLDIERHSKPERLDPSRRPVVMIPGYAMNAFILGYHPRGRSMVEYLTDQGLEVWTANLRGQGQSTPCDEASPFGFRELATIDLPTVRDVVQSETHSDASTIDVVGCSLGATYVYAYLALHPDDHGIERMVAIGGPLRWIDIHPAVRLAFASPTIAGALPSSGTRLLARLALPIVKRFPAIASLYMNAHQIDLEKADDIVETVDDPHPELNRQIARWLNNRDLMVDNTNITSAMHAVHTPILCVLANKDGIVPPTSALSILKAIGTDDCDVLRVGDDDAWFAHADLFISDQAEAAVFEPLAAWLLAK